MPLRKWMSAHGHPSWWSWLVVIGGCLTSMIVSIIISAEMNQRGINRERMARFESQQRWCLIIVTLDDTYRQTPPTTPAGRNMARGIRDLRNDYRCPPKLPDMER